MAVSDIEAVLNFLRKNGLSEAESALKDDILEIENIISFDFEKFQSPINPTLPPVRIELGQSKLGISDNVLACSSSSSDDFISLGSSGFTNPYGFPSTTQTNKSDDSSSDRLSQFGTARNYPDSGMLNDMFLCDEKDEDYFDKDFVSCRSEDKFITTSNAIEQYENSSGKSFFLSNNLIDGIFLKDCYDLYKTSQLENGIEAEPKGGSESNLLVPIYDCCIGLEGFNVEEFEDGNRLKIVKEPNLIDNGETKCPSGRDFTSENRVLESGNSSIDKESANFNRENFKKGSGLGIQVSEQPLEPFEDDCFEIDDSLLMAEEAHDGQVAGDGENCSTENDLPIYEAIEDEYEVFDLRIIHRKNRTGFEASKDLPIVLNTILVGRYYVTEYLGSAAFSKVVQAHDIQMGIDVCLKIIKNDKDFFDQSLDEIKLLKFINKHDPSDHHHILRLYDYFYHQEHLFIVCELLRANLYEFQKFNRDSGAEVYFTLPRLQSITRQCLEALEFLHQLGIIHSDLKPENILIKSYSRCKIKVIDLGSSCFRSDNLNLYVQSRSYRAPEVILGLPYDEKIDIWSLGCILAELSSGHVLFPNEALVVILTRIIGMLGPIDMEMIVNGQETDKYFTKEYDLYRMNEETNQLEYIIPEESSLEHQVEVTDIRFIEFIKELLETNPRRRPSASEALKHPWLLYQYE